MIKDVIIHDKDRTWRSKIPSLQLLKDDWVVRRRDDDVNLDEVERIGMYGDGESVWHSNPLAEEASR
jgi:hypothetical protein